MTSRNSLAQLDNELNQPNLPRLKRKKKDSLTNDKNKRPCLTQNNQSNVIDQNNQVKNDKFKKTKRNNTNKAKQINSTLESKVDRSNLELTPASTIASTSFRQHELIHNSPLPNFMWANSDVAWKNLLKAEDEYNSYRDPKMFDRHPTLQPSMRAMLLDWLNEVSQAYNLTRQTYYLALDFFDRFLSTKQNMPKKQLQMLGITCMFIAAKIEEIFPPKLERFAFVCDGACDENDILVNELVILNALNWELSPMTPISWLSLFTQIYSSMDKENVENIIYGEQFLMPDYQSKLFVQIAHLIDLCTLSAGSLDYSYSVIAAAAFYHFTNENVVLQCTGKTMSEMRSCIEWMIPFAIAIKNEGLDFIDKIPLEDDPKCTDIQKHTVSLELLKNAQTIQTEIESEKMTLMDSSDSGLNVTSTPSKLPLTPPNSTN